MTPSKQTVRGRGRRIGGGISTCKPAFPPNVLWPPQGDVLIKLIQGATRVTYPTLPKRSAGGFCGAISTKMEIRGV